MIPEPSPEDQHDCPLCSDKISRAGLKLLTESLPDDPMNWNFKTFVLPGEFKTKYLR